MNGEEIHGKSFAEVEKAVALAKQNLPDPVLIVFEPPVNEYVGIPFL